MRANQILIWAALLLLSVFSLLVHNNTFSTIFSAAALVVLAMP